MAIKVNITNIVGQEPYDIYICQSGGTECFYIDTTSDTSYEFDIPKPYNTSLTYTIKIIDANDCVIENTKSV